MSSNVKCENVHINYHTCENCIKNKLNNCRTCPFSQGKCSSCKYKNK